MGLAGPARPRVSRETRLLLATILISIAALWALARLRFPDRPVTTNPVPPLLTQLSVPPGFEDLASEITKLDSRLLPSLVSVGNTPSLRVRDSIGAIYVAPDGRGDSASIEEVTLISRDPASGLTLVSIPGAPAPELAPWTNVQFERSRYLVAADVSPVGVSLRPIFIGRLHPVNNPAWLEPIWMLPPRTAVSPGDFLFTTDGALAGLVVTHAGGPALVPGETVLKAVDILLDSKRDAFGWLGVEVQALPSSLTVGPASGSGVIVTWVDPRGPAAEKLFPLDVIEAAGGDAIASPADWRVRASRLIPGAPVVFRVRRGVETIAVSVTAAGHVAPPKSAALGLTMRTVRGTGAEALQVADGSAAARAGIREGDVITAIDDIRAPTTQQVTRAFEMGSGDRPILVAITRGSVHRVLAIDKK